MILISNHFFLDFYFYFVFYVKIIFINESGRPAHCSHLSRSRRPMSQLGRSCLSRTEIGFLRIWYGHEGSGFNIWCIIERQELLQWIALTEAGIDAEQTSLETWN